MLRRLVAISLLIPTMALSGPYFTPERGTRLRHDLMDAIRPHAEWDFGAPVEFVVEDLRVNGDVAFASLAPQRPGGGAIDVYRTPMYRRGEINPEFNDGVYMQVLYRKSGNVWVALHWAVGATDVWYSERTLCRVFRRVTPEVCP